MLKPIFYCFLLLFVFIGCKKTTLHTISVEEFAHFVEETNYVTDAEKFAWSIKQITIFDYVVVEHVDWRCPDGEQESRNGFPVTQVSYNDALAYAKWAGVKIPSYEEYWEKAQGDGNFINSGTSQILPNDQVSVIGNVWDMTVPDKLGRIRLAGGSYLCRKHTCDGTSPDRRLYVDQMTGNTHVGFSVLVKE